MVITPCPLLRRVDEVRRRALKVELVLVPIAALEQSRDEPGILITGVGPLEFLVPRHIRGREVCG